MIPAIDNIIINNENSTKQSYSLTVFSLLSFSLFCRSVFFFKAYKDKTFLTSTRLVAVDSPSHTEVPAPFSLPGSSGPP